MFYLFLGFAIYPIYEIIIDLLQACTELLKAKISVRIMECNFKIDKIKTSMEEEQPSSSFAIGFHMPEEPEEEDEDYE